MGKHIQAVLLAGITVITITFLLPPNTLKIITDNVVPVAYAKQVISIIPGASDNSRQRFFDITFYPIKTGTKLSWLNDDNINHRLLIKQRNNGTAAQMVLVADSGKILPESSFSYKFDTPGLYHFSSPTYPWMQGDVLVTDDVSTAVVEHLKNKIDVGLTWSPSNPKVGQITHFVISFLKEKADKNQEHIDYAFAVDDANGKTLYGTGSSSHSSGGVEQVSYKFENAGKYLFMVTIYGIVFQPVEPEEATFTITTTTTP
jgi:plastocyanin